MTYLEILAALEKQNPDALLLEPREVYDSCLVDITDEPNDHWPREPGHLVAVYGAEKCIEAIATMFETDLSSAIEWFGFNTSGAWMGQGTPTFRHEAYELDDEEEH